MSVLEFERPLNVMSVYLETHFSFGQVSAGFLRDFGEILARFVWDFDHPFFLEIKRKFTVFKIIVAAAATGAMAGALWHGYPQPRLLPLDSKVTVP